MVAWLLLYPCAVVCTAVSLRCVRRWCLEVSVDRGVARFAVGCFECVCLCACLPIELSYSSGRVESDHCSSLRMLTPPLLLAWLCAACRLLLVAMTNSLKKNDPSRPRHQAERVLLDRTNSMHPASARSSSHKKTAHSSGSVALPNGSSSARSVSSKKKKKAAWDDTIQDLSVHKLPKAQLQAKHEMMKRAAREHSRERIGLPPAMHAEVMSPPTQRGHQRSASSQSARGRSRSPASFTSPASDSSAPSSAASTPDSLHQHHDSDSAASTPSPQEIAQRRRQQLQPQTTVVSARPQVPRQVRPVKKEAAPAAPIPAAPMTRMSAAPVMTSAPVSLNSSFAEEEEQENSFSAFAPAPGSAPSAPIANYSPWLKPNHVLSPVLERSIVDSAASTPSAPNQQQQQAQPQQPLDRPFFTDLSNVPSVASSPERPAAAPVTRRNDHVAQPTEEKQGSGRNLLDELRQSLDHPAADVHSQQHPQQNPMPVGTTLANLPLPTQHHFMTLLRQVMTHLSDREATASQEAQFKANTVASISGCTAQLKQMSLRIEQVEREKLELVEQAQENQREMQAMQQRLAMMEQRLEMMNGGRPLQQPVPQLQLQQPAPAQSRPLQQPVQQPQQSAAYDPSLYHSQHVLPNPSLFHSSNYNSASATPAATAVRSQSPPRPIVINHATQSASVQSAPQPHPASQSRTLNGSRPHEVSVQLTDSFKPMMIAAGGGARNMAMAPTPVVASHKVAWQTYRATPTQQQPQQQSQQSKQAMQPEPAHQMQQQHQPRQPAQHLPASHSQLASRFQPSSLRDDVEDAECDDAEDDDEEADAGELDDEAPRRTLPAHPSDRFAPFSPGSEQDEEEARQFAEQAARMRQGQQQWTRQ